MTFLRLMLLSSCLRVGWGGEGRLMETFFPTVEKQIQSITHTPEAWALEVFTRSVVVMWAS